MQRPAPGLAGWISKLLLPVNRASVFSSGTTQPRNTESIFLKICVNPACLSVSPSKRFTRQASSKVPDLVSQAITNTAIPSFVYSCKRSSPGISIIMAAPTP